MLSFVNRILNLVLVGNRANVLVKIVVACRRKVVSLPHIKGKIMKNEFEKMRSQELYSFADAEVNASIVRAQKLCARLRTMTMHDADYREVMTQLIPGMPDSAIICPPFHCDHGTGIRLGEGVFVNYNCVMLDSGYIQIGRNTKIGPNCQFYTPNHPADAVARRHPQETAFPITIGEDCWIAGGVIVCPGVTIGDRCIIAAGSVVVHDIPADSMAAGCPAVVKKQLVSGGE